MCCEVPEVYSSVPVQLLHNAIIVKQPVAASSGIICLRQGSSVELSAVEFS